MNDLYVDVERCIGCRHCEMACAIEHSSGKTLFSMLSDPKRPQPRVEVGLGVDLLTFPVKCLHCDPAPCLEACPSNAIYRDGKTGAVIIREEKCIACGMCAMVCPNNAIHFSHSTGKKKVYKCDFCVERQHAGKAPACVNACVTGALLFGNGLEMKRQRSHAQALDATKSMKGQITLSIPWNIQMFRDLQEQLARFGPLPSSKEDNE